MKMNGMDDEHMSPQNFLYGCVLEAGKEVVFNPEDDEFDHQLDLRMACVDPSTKDQLNVVEVEGHNSEGQKVKAVLVSLKPSTMPSVCLGGFTISPPAVFRLKAGAGPVHLSGQHLIMMEPDQSFGEEEEDEEEEDEEEVEEVEVKMSNKRPAASPPSKPQKKMKIAMEEEDEDDDEDEDEDDEEDDEESEEEESPVKAKPTPAKQKKNPQNGKSPAPSTPATKQGKSPKVKGEKSPKTPTPKVDLTVPEIKAKIVEATKKGVSLPKVQSKFENFLKHGQNVSDTKVIAELWKWRQTLTDDK